MIPARELRPGNLIGMLDASYVVSAVNEEDNTIKLWNKDKTKSLGTFNLDSVDIYPIPLTEEQLIAFSYECIQEFIIYLIHYSIHPVSDNVSWWIATISPLHIHEIQNLWCVITGEELTTK